MLSNFYFKDKTRVKLVVLLALVISIFTMNVAFAVDLTGATVTLYEDEELTVPLTDNSYTYDGLEKKPFVKVVVDGTTLTSDDYEVIYHDNINANEMLDESVVTDPSTGVTTYSGRAYIELAPKGDNTGSFKYAPFVINRLDLATANIECSVSGSKIYDGQVSHPHIDTAVLVLDNGQRVDLGWSRFQFDGTDIIDVYDRATDTIVSTNGPESNQLDVGSYYIDIYGSNYINTYTVWVHVFPALLSCEWDPLTFEYDGTPHAPDVTISTNVPGQSVTDVTVKGQKKNAGEDYEAIATPEGVEDQNGVYENYDFTKIGFANLAEYISYAGRYTSLEEFIVDYDYIAPANGVTASAYQDLVDDYVANFDENTSDNILNYLLDEGVITLNSFGSLNVSFYTNFDVTPRPLYVTADDKSIYLNEAIPGLTWKVSGEVSGEESAFDGELETDADPTVRGSWPITLGTLIIIDNAPGKFLASNYEMNFTEGTIKIKEEPKPILDPNVAYPEDKIYKGSEWEQPLEVKVDDVVLTLDEHYTVTYTENIDVGTVTMTIEAVPDSGYYTDEPIYREFDILPAPLTVEWSDIDTFYYDGENHIRKGYVSGEVPGETIVYTLEENKIDVADYTAVITITGVEGGQEKLSNYELPDPADLERPFSIIPLPITTPEDTYEPEDDPASDPETDPVPGYTVEVLIEWPDEEYTYNGEEQGPEPTVTLVIKDDTGNPVERKTLVKDTDYTLDYDNNIDAAEDTDPNAPQVVVEGKGPNFSGTTDPHKYTINPAVIKVTADNKTKIEGEDNPELTYTETQGPVAGETAAYTGDLACAADTTTPAGTQVPITQGTFALTDGPTTGTTQPFKASNYELQFTEGTLTVKAEPKQITAAGVTDPEDKEYKGSEWIQDPTVTVDGVTLVKDTDYTVTYTENIDVGTATITVTGIGEYKGTVEKTFEITPVPLTVNWSDLYQFQYDGVEHIRKGTVTSPITGETVDYTLATKQVDVGDDYVATITINGIIGGQENLDNYILPSAADLQRPFEIQPLPIKEVKPTVDPTDDPDDPTTEPAPGYTVEVVIEWPTDDFTYNGAEQKPSPTVTLVIKDSTGSTVGTPVPLTEGTDYEVIYSNNIDAATKDDTNAPQAFVRGLGDNITGDSDPYKFTIKPVPMVVDWSDKDTFQFDGQYHIRKGTVTADVVDGEVITFTLTGKERNVGEGYEAVIEVTGVEGGRGKISNYILPNPDDLVETFKIVTLPLPDQKPTVEPEDDPEQDPATEPDEGYTVEVVVTWPDDPYDYDGTEKLPVPEKVELIIKDPDGNPVGDPVPLEEGTDYTLEYDNNVDAGDPSSPQPPTVTIVAVDGGNFEGEADYPFTIKPAKLVVKADNKSKKQGKENPELTYKVTGAKNGEEPAFDGALETTAEKSSPKGTYPIYCDGKLTAKDNGTFKASNYDVEYIDATLTIKSGSTAPAAPSVPNDKIVELGVDLRSGSPNPDKGNKNHYKIVEEEVIYWVDYINGGDDIGNTVNLVLNIPLDFDILDSDGGTVDKVNRKITWKFKDGLKHNEGGTKEVHLKYTKFSKSGITSEDIYPLATIAVLSDIKDKSAVHNIVYTDGTTVETEHKVYMWGDEDTPTFRPTDYISRAEGAMVLLRIFDIDYQPTVVKGDEFPDLGETYEQAQKAIVKATELGLINGYEDGTYRPNRSMTRGEFMKLIAVYVVYKAEEDGIEGIDLDDTKTVTKYAAQNNWANKYVTLLNRLNLTPISEENPDLDIEEKITRAEVAQLCNLYLMRAPVYDDGKIELPFEDVDKDTELWGDIVEATRPSHEGYDLTEDVFEVWDYDDWKKAYDEGFTNKYLY